MNAQEEQLPYGTKITCPGGEVFAYYPKKGTVVVQGDTSTEPESTDGVWFGGGWIDVESASDLGQ